MSEKFSIEDILNEVKNMKGDTYLSGVTSKAVKDNNNEETVSFDISASKKEEKSANANEAFKPISSMEQNLPDDIDKTDDTENDIPDFSKMTAKDLFGQIAANTDDDESEIVNGFMVKSDLASPAKDEQIKEKANINVAQKAENAENHSENLENTIVFDKSELKSNIENNQHEEIFNKSSEKTEPDVEIEKSENETKSADENSDIFGGFVKRRTHTPEHLLSAEEIKSGFENEKPSFRFSERVKDLTKSRKKEPAETGFADFMKPAEKSAENSEIAEDVVESIPEEVVEKSTASQTDTKASAEELFEFLSGKYAEKGRESSKQSSVQNTADEVAAESAEQNDIEEINEIKEIDEVKEIKEVKADSVEEIPADIPLTFEKEGPVFSENDEDKEIKSTSRGQFSRKTSRRIFERSLDYSEDSSPQQEVIDDYTSIEDEEAVRYDLDISLKKVSKRLLITIVIFVLGFILTVLPTVGFDLLKLISKEENLTGFMVVNSIMLGATLLVNVFSFLRGLGSFITLKPNEDSPLSIASLFVVAQCVVAFIPEFSAAAGSLPFYTAALVFAYVLNLMGKKSMVMRIRANFRMVANTAVKQSCFAADDRMCEMLESDDFIGTPYVAVSKSVLNLHNFLKNSYSEDPSDNVSRIFAPISLIASAVTFIFTYFVSKDAVSSLAYATAVSIAALPASVILSVNSPLKKAALQFRQKDGLLTGYESVNEFFDVDCVAFDAEDLFPAGSVELTGLRAIGDVSIEDVILKSAALTIAAGGPLADVFDKIIDGRRKMLPDVSGIVYEDGLGLSGKLDGKTVRIGNRQFIDSYGIYGLSDSEIDVKAKQNGSFVIYTAVEDEVCGMFALKYKSIDPDIEDAVYNLVSNGVSIAVKSNDPNITSELIEKVFEVPKEYVLVMQAHTAEHYDEITTPSKNGDSLLAFGGSSTVFSNLIIACKKLKAKISVAVLIQIVLTILGFGICMFTAVSSKGFANIDVMNVIVYQFVAAVLSVAIPSFIKQIK